MVARASLDWSGAKYEVAPRKHFDLRFHTFGKLGKQLNEG
jgi:hypothetical protein